MHTERLNALLFKHKAGEGKERSERLSLCQYLASFLYTRSCISFLLYACFYSIYCDIIHMKGGRNVKFTYSWLVRFIKLMLDLFFPPDPPEEEPEEEEEEEKKGGEKE